MSATYGTMDSLRLLRDAALGLAGSVIVALGERVRKGTAAAEALEMGYVSTLSDAELSAMIDTIQRERTLRVSRTWGAK